MHADKLEKLAAFLDTLEPSRFYYGEWVNKNWGGHQDLSCGTTACAMGWTPTLFPDEVELYSYESQSARRTFKVVGIKHKLYEGSLNDVFMCSIRAAMKLFDIDSMEANWLFTPQADGSYDEDLAPPQYVAKKIRAFINAGTIDFSWLPSMNGCPRRGGEEDGLEDQ